MIQTKLYKVLPKDSNYELASILKLELSFQLLHPDNTIVQVVSKFVDCVVLFKRCNTMQQTLVAFDFSLSNWFKSRKI